LNITQNKITCYPTCTSSAGGKAEPLPSIGKQIFVDPSVKVCPAPPVFSNYFFVQQVIIGCSGDEFQNSCLPAFRDTIAAVYAQNAPRITASSTFSGFDVTDQNGIAVVQLSYAVNFATPPTYDYTAFSNILIRSISDGVFLKLLVSFAAPDSCLTKGVTLKSITTIEKQLPSVNTVVSYRQSLQTMLFLVFVASVPFIMVAAYIKRKRDKVMDTNIVLRKMHPPSTRTLYIQRSNTNTQVTLFFGGQNRIERGMQSTSQKITSLRIATLLILPTVILLMESMSFTTKSKKSRRRSRRGRSRLTRRKKRFPKPQIVNCRHAPKSHIPKFSVSSASKCIIAQRTVKICIGQRTDMSMIN